MASPVRPNLHVLAAAASHARAHPFHAHGPPAGTTLPPFLQTPGPTGMHGGTLPPPHVATGSPSPPPHDVAALSQQVQSLQESLASLLGRAPPHAPPLGASDIRGPCGPPFWTTPPPRTPGIAGTAWASPQPSSSVLPRRAPPPRPSVTTSMPGHALRKFWTDWAIYKRLAHIPAGDLTVELYLTCDAALQSAVFTADPVFTALTEPDLAALITGLVTQQQNRAAARNYFRSLTQQPDESIRDFVTRASQAAADCEYTCHACGVNQVDEHVRDQLLIGVYDQALQQDVLSKDRTLPTLSAVVTHCVGFESALRDQEAFRTAVPPAVHAAQSSRATPPKPTPSRYSSRVPHRENNNPRPDTAGPCSGCGSTSHGRGTRKSACPAWDKTCDSCGKANHFASVCRSQPPTTVSGLVAHMTWDDDKAAFTPASALASLTVSILPIASRDSPLTHGSHQVTVHPDTGAQVSLAGPPLLATLGLTPNRLLPTTQRIRAIGGTPLPVLGYIPTLITTLGADHAPRSTHEVIYIVRDVSGVFLSLAACKALGVVPCTFPRPGPPPTVAPTLTGPAPTCRRTPPPTRPAGRWDRGPNAMSRFPARLAPDLAATATTAIAALTEVSHDGAISWSELQSTGATDTTYLSLLQAIQDGFPPQRQAVPAALLSFWGVRDRLSTVDGVALMDSRPVIPTVLRARVLEALHSAHQGVAGMKARARLSVYWPGLDKSLRNRLDTCHYCRTHAPSLPREPLALAPSPSWPYDHVAVDYFDYAGKSYLVYVDRYSGNLHVFHYPPGRSDARHLISSCRSIFLQYGAPRELASDGGPTLVSKEFRDFLTHWGVTHRLSSAYYAQSNGRAELGVKAARRIIADSTGRDGSVDTDAVARAILQYRNTPLSHIDKSPAQLLFGRVLRDHLPTHQHLLHLHPDWLRSAEDREAAFTHRNAALLRRHDTSCKALPALTVGDHVAVQNQGSNHPRRWDRTGTVVEAAPHRQYTVRLDGSGRATIRNRRFLRPLHTPTHTSSTAHDQPVTSMDVGGGREMMTNE